MRAYICRYCDLCIKALAITAVMASVAQAQVATPPPPQVLNSLPPLGPRAAVPFAHMVERVAEGANILVEVAHAAELGRLVGEFAKQQIDYRNLSSYTERSVSILQQLHTLTDISQAIEPLCIHGVGQCVAAVTPVNAAAILLAQQLRDMGPALVAERARTFSVGQNQTTNLTTALDFTNSGISGFVKSTGLIVGAGLLQTGGYLGLGVTPKGLLVGPAALKLIQTGVVEAANIWVGPGSVLSGSGTLSGTVANLGGEITPGSSAGTLTFGRDFYQTGGILDIELGGITSDQFDRLIVRGAAHLEGGIIRFSLLNGFIPDDGNAFEFLTADAGIFLDQRSVSLEFTNFSAANFELVVRGGNRLTLQVGDGLPGPGHPTDVPEPSTLLLLLGALLPVYAVVRGPRFGRSGVRHASDPGPSGLGRPVRGPARAQLTRNASLSR